MYVLTEDELTVLDRVAVRLEAYLDQYGETDAPGVVLVEEELDLVRELMRRADEES